ALDDKDVLFAVWMVVARVLLSRLNGDDAKGHLRLRVDLAVAQPGDHAPVKGRLDSLRHVGDRSQIRHPPKTSARTESPLISYVLEQKAPESFILIAKFFSLGSSPNLCRPGWRRLQARAS